MADEPEIEICDRCEGPMERGFVADTAHSSRRPGVWAEGLPESGIFGIKQFRKRRRFVIQAWRCTKCGWLDLYARIRDY